MITIDKLSFQYAGSDRPALKDISIHIPKGDFVGIIGESGAGKSTLAYALSGIVPHHFKGDYYGSVKIKDMDTFDVEPGELALHVGSVFQDVDAQMVSSLVENELLFGLENFGVPKEEIETRITETLEEIGISHLRDRQISSLSGGQKQKVAIAAMVAIRPDILVLDEPTGELDPRSSRQIFEMLRRLNEKYGMTIVVIEQKIMLLSEFVKRMVVMSKGEILYDDKVEEILKHSESLQQIGINCPRVVSLCNALAEDGLSSGELHADIAGTADLIRRILA